MSNHNFDIKRLSARVAAAGAPIAVLRYGPTTHRRPRRIAGGLAKTKTDYRENDVLDKQVLTRIKQSLDGK